MEEDNTCVVTFNRLQKALEEMKNNISREVSVACPDFSKSFDADTDASKRQLGA